MRKSVALLLVLVFLTASCLIVAEPVSAQDGVYGNLNMISPNSYTAYTDTMLLDLTIAWGVSGVVTWISAKVSYRIDNGPTIAITGLTNVNFEISRLTHADSVVNISSLADGKHKLTIVAGGDYCVNQDFIRSFGCSFAPVYFCVNIVIPPEITVLSPQFKRYNSADVPLNFTVDVPTFWIGYSLDGRNNETLGGNMTLAGLSDGLHSLVVYAGDVVGNTGVSRNVSFSVAVPPKVSIFSPIRWGVYNESVVPLVFTLDKPVNRTWYSLDGQLNVTVAGNGTIAGLSDGMHRITVYADDAFGNVAASSQIYFSVEVPEVPEPQPEPFPIVPVAAASVAAVAIVGVGLLLYFKKRS